MQTKTLRLLLPLFLLILTFSLGKAQSKLDFKGDFNWKNRHFVWTLEPDANRPEHRRLFIREILKENNRPGSSVIVYNTTYYARKIQDKISYVKIFGARRFGYTWSALTTDYLQIGFAGRDITYALSGDLMNNPKNKSKVPDDKIKKTVPAAFDEKEAVKIAAEYFIMTFYTLLENGSPAPAASKKDSDAGTLDFGGSYLYEIKQNFYRFGDGQIKIRQADKSLAYSSLIRIADDRESLKKITISLHLAKLKNYSWGIYDSDYCQMTFDYETGKITYERHGSVIPVPQKTAGFPTSFRPESDDLSACMKTAVSYFSLQYADELYLKQ